MQRLCLCDFPLGPLSLSPSLSLPRSLSLARPIHSTGPQGWLFTSNTPLSRRLLPTDIKSTPLPKTQNWLNRPVRLIKPKGTSRAGEGGGNLPPPPRAIIPSHLRMRRLVSTSFPRFSSSPCLLATYFHFPLRRVSSRFTSLKTALTFLFSCSLFYPILSTSSSSMGHKKPHVNYTNKSVSSIIYYIWVNRRLKKMSFC